MPMFLVKRSGAAIINDRSAFQRIMIFRGGRKGVAERDRRDQPSLAEIFFRAFLVTGRRKTSEASPSLPQLPSLYQYLSLFTRKATYVRYSNYGVHAPGIA